MATLKTVLAETIAWIIYVAFAAFLIIILIAGVLIAFGYVVTAVEHVGWPLVVIGYLVAMLGLSRLVIWFFNRKEEPEDDETHLAC